MAKYDLDNSRSDPQARQSNQLALLGTVATLALVIGAGYLQSHPYQTGGAAHHHWFADLSYQGRGYQEAGVAIEAPDARFTRVGTTSDGRGIFRPVGGGGGQGTVVHPLYLKLDNGYYQPIKPR